MMTTVAREQVFFAFDPTLKPAECSLLTLTTLVVCTGGNCNGTGASELVMGTSNGERIRGRGGTHCIVGGGAMTI